MDHMAALTECSEIATGVISGVVISVSGSEHNSGGAYVSDHVYRANLNPDPSTAAITPRCYLGVPPAPVSEMVDQAAMRSTAALTSPLRATEANSD